MSETDGLEWLRRALGRDYQVEREIGAPGDVARVLARELSLDRPVELLALRPEATSDSRTQEFLAWGQLLARVNHPNVAAVYRAGRREGVPFLAIEHLPFDTLAMRLRLGPLGAGEAVRLGRDVLRGLEASHAAGVARPGLGTGEVVRARDRGVLVGLGRAFGEHASADADLVAAAAVLYQAVAGRPWNQDEGGAFSAWRPVPRRLRPVLRRALASRLEDRWPDAAGFRRELERLDATEPRRFSAGRVLSAVGLMAVAAGAWALWPSVSRRLWPLPPGSPPLALAILPLDAAGDPGSDAHGVTIANHAKSTLDDVAGLELTSPELVADYLEREGRSVDGVEAARVLKARVAHGILLRRGDSLLVRLTLFDSLPSGQPLTLDDIPGSVQSIDALGDTIAVRLLRAVHGPLADLSGVPLGALKAFLQGEAAFARDAWDLAARYYETAIGADSSFALARWRLANVERWRRRSPTFDLRTFYQRDGHLLLPRDREQVEALLEPDIERRLALLEEAVDRAHGDLYAHFLYAEELFHRGPLVGRGLERAARAMRQVIALDSSFAEAYNHLFVVHLRAGRKTDARTTLELRRRVALRPAPGDPDVLALLQLAYDERFVGWRGAIKRWYLDTWADSAKLADVARVARLGVPWFDLPATQIALNRIVLRRQAPTDSARASARAGIALGLMAAGRPEEALAQLDSAVSLLPTAEARLQQAEWRAIPRFLGLPGAGTASDPAWEARLDTLAADSATAARALWALALRGLGAGDTAVFERARARIDQVAPGSPLAVLLRAVGEGARGRPGVALATSDSVRPLFAVNHPPDPFAGAVFHLQRGDWLAARGDRRGADREWAWYEGSDFEGWPSGIPQAGEIEATFGAYAGWKRGAARLAGAASRGDTLAACALLARSVARWRGAETGMDSLRAEAEQQAGGCPR